MTCKEKCKKENPMIMGLTNGLAPGCPSDHGYLPNPDYCEWPFKYPEKCLACWDREIPENNKAIEKEKETMNETEWVRTEVPMNDLVNRQSTSATSATKDITITEHRIAASEEPTSADIELEMHREREKHRVKMARMAKDLEEAKKREKMEEAAKGFKTLVDSYISAGFTRDEAMAIITTSLKALSIN